MTQVIPTIFGMSKESYISFILLFLLQFLEDQEEFCEAAICSHKRGTLWMVIIGKVHSYAMHGRSFQMSIRRLKPLFFEKLFGNANDDLPLLLYGLHGIDDNAAIGELWQAHQC